MIRIPWARPAVGVAEAEAAREAILATRLSMGANVLAFETAMAEHAARRHAVAVTSGTSALELAIQLVGIGPGHEVLVPALSYVATVNCLVKVGARPIFCDVLPESLNIDPDEAARQITRRTRAILVADYCGYSVDYGALAPLAEEHGLTLVVDGAQSIGTSFAGRPTLAYGLVSTTSFHAAKALTTGEGGMVFFDDDEMLPLARRLRSQGEVEGRKYVHDAMGANLRMTDFQAAIGRVQAARLPELLSRRAELAARYTLNLEGRRGVELLQPPAGSTPAWFSFPVLVDERDRIAAGLLAEGVETRSLYPLPAYRQPIAGYPRRVTPRPVAEHACRRVLNLPMFHDLGLEQVDEVCELLLALLDEPARELASR